MTVFASPSLQFVVKGMSSSAASTKEIKFLAVARRSDKVIVASYTHKPDPNYDYVEKVKQVMSSPGWATVTTDRISLEDGGYIFFVLSDQGGRVYIAITSRSYTSRYIYSNGTSHRGVLTVVQEEVTNRFGDLSLTAGPNALNGKMAPILKMLCNEFNDLKGLDKISSVQAKVDQVTGVMKENMSLALKNNDRIEDIDVKASDLADGAKKFSAGATNLMRHSRWQLIRCYLLVAVVVIAVLAAIIAYFVNSK